MQIRVLGEIKMMNKIRGQNKKIKKIQVPHMSKKRRKKGGK
jgi:hypothetical protein